MQSAPTLPPDALREAAFDDRAPSWCETLEAPVYRSEAFAEDLDDDAAPLAFAT